MGAILALKGGRKGASSLISYVNRYGKLDENRLYGYEILTENKLAQEQLAATRRVFNKTGGIQAFHWVQSFDKEFDKNNPEHVEKAHQIGVKFVDEIAKEYPNHEIYMGTHTDSDSGYIHNHIVFSSVNNKTGKKFHSNNDVGYNLQDINDRVLAEFGFAQPTEKFKQVDYEMHSEGKLSNREKTKHMVINARDKSLSFDEFKENLEKDFGVEVYEFNQGKRIGYKWTDSENKEFTIGARKLGLDYEKKGLETAFEANRKELEINNNQANINNDQKIESTFKFNETHKINTTKNPIETKNKITGNQIKMSPLENVIQSITNKAKKVNNDVDREKRARIERERAIEEYREQQQLNRNQSNDWER